jgi:hypothetical protein
VTYGTRPRVDPADGPVARIGTPEWNAWRDYYVKVGRRFSAAEMDRYKRMGSHWPVQAQWPPGLQTKTEAK